MSKACRVCAHVGVERINRALASGQSANALSKVYRGLSRRQLRYHRERCLIRNPLLVHALRAGELDYDQLGELLRNAGSSAEDATKIVEGVRDHLEGREAS